jgi:hypothetical protein
MHTSFSIILLCVLFLSSCSRPDVRVHPGGKLSAAERKALVGMQQEFVDWTPTHSAVWNGDGFFRHVCLRDTFVSDLGSLYEIVIFDEHGQVLEANYIRLNGVTRVECVSPVKIRCSTGDRSFLACMAYAPEEGRRRLISSVAYQKRMHL